MGVTVLYSSGDHGVAGNLGYCSTETNGLQLSVHDVGVILTSVYRGTGSKRDYLHTIFPWILSVSERTRLLCAEFDRRYLPGM
jgi:hypothetical protein